MTETEKAKRLKDEFKYDYNLLANAQVAAQLLKEGGKAGPQLAGKALEMILADTKMYDPAGIKVLTDPDVVRKTIESQLFHYQRCKGEDTVAELIQYNESDLEKYVQGGVARVRTEFGDLLDKPYSEIEKALAKAEYIIKGEEHGRSTKSEVEAAKKVAEKYQRLIHTIGILEEKRTSEFRAKVDEELRKENYAQLYKEPEMQEAT